MKVSRLFAGVLIVLLGIALFLSNYNILHFDWEYFFKMWPVLLVLAGISVLVSNPKWKAVLYAVTIVLVIVWMISAATSGWRSLSNVFDGEGGNVRSQEFTQEMDKDVKRASLTISGGAGAFTLKDTTSDLLEARSESNIGHYSFDSDKEGTAESLNLTFEGKEHNWHFGSSKNTLDLSLNTRPAWDLDINVGACSVNFDLSPYKVRRASIKAGASSITLRVGDKADTTSLRMETGASKLAIYVPESAGCRIMDNAELSSKSFAGFTKGDDGFYRSPNYDSAKKKVFIDVQAGVSSVKVIRY